MTSSQLASKAGWSCSLLPLCIVLSFQRREEEEQREEEEGQSSNDARQQSEGMPQADGSEPCQDGDGQLPVNTLFYGVRGQQVGFALLYLCTLSHD